MRNIKFDKAWEKNQNIFKSIVLILIVAVFLIIATSISKETNQNTQEDTNVKEKIVAENEELKIQIKMPVDKNGNLAIRKNSSTPVTIVNNNDLDVTDVYVSFGLYDDNGNEIESDLYTNWTCEANSGKTLNVKLSKFNNPDYKFQVSIKNRFLVENNSDNARYTNISEVTTDDISDQDIWIYTQYVVKENLKSPKSAKFPYIEDAEIIRSSDSIIVKSYVDAENSFGAKIRSDFVVTLSADGQRAISVIID